MRAFGCRADCGRASDSGYDSTDMDTVTLTIDGQSVTVEKGTTVLQAAIERGVSVPY
jgi:hypothetical protein